MRERRALGRSDGVRRSISSASVMSPTTRRSASTTSARLSRVEMTAWKTSGRGVSGWTTGKSRRITLESGVSPARPISRGPSSPFSKPPAAVRSRSTRLTMPICVPWSSTTGRRFNRRWDMTSARGSGVAAWTVTGPGVITSSATLLPWDSGGSSRVRIGTVPVAARRERV
jgi:hypothetical protein